MTIVHVIDEFLEQLSPGIKGKSEEKTAAFIKVYYSTATHVPEVTLKGDVITIDININQIAAEKSEYARAVKFCEAGKYDQAIPIIEALIKQSPAHSEYPVINLECPNCDEMLLIVNIMK